MKWLRTIILFDRGDIALSADWKLIHESYVRSIKSIDFPPGTGTLTLRRKFQRPDGQWNRNGVGYLKARFLESMVKAERWHAEGDVNLGAKREPPGLRLYPSGKAYQEPITSDFGGFDFVTTTPKGMHVAIEWETGNISSSHRSMNKLAISLRTGGIQAAVLILPSRNLYQHLTDRIGNIGELSGYLSMWVDMGKTVKRGLLAVSVVEHDHLTDNPKHKYLPAGNAGRARQGRAKRR